MKEEGKEEEKKERVDTNKKADNYGKEMNKQNGLNQKKDNGGGSPKNTTSSSQTPPSLPPSSSSSAPAAAAAAGTPGTQKETMDLDKIAIHHLTLVLAPLALGFAAR